MGADAGVTICTKLWTVAEDKHGKPWFWLGTVPPPGYEPPDVRSTTVVTEVDRGTRTITITGAMDELAKVNARIDKRRAKLKRIRKRLEK